MTWSFDFNATAFTFFLDVIPRPASHSTPKGCFLVASLVGLPLGSRLAPPCDASLLNWASCLPSVSSHRPANLISCHFSVGDPPCSHASGVRSHG